MRKAHNRRQRGAPKAKARRRRVQARRGRRTERLQIGRRTVRAASWLSLPPLPLHTPLALPLETWVLGTQGPTWAGMECTGHHSSPRFNQSCFLFGAPRAQAPAGTKRKSTALNFVFNCSGKFVIRENSDCVQKPGDAHSYWET